MEESDVEDLVAQELAKLGANIARRRKERGLSQTDLTEISGISRAHISRIEVGQMNLRFETLVRIAKALRTTTVNLLR